MTITLTDGVSPVVLCDGSSYIGTAGKFIGPLDKLQTEAEWSIRPKRPIGAADETPLDGGHAVWPFAFSVWVEWGTLDAAQEFADTWAASLERDGVSLVIDYLSGNQTTRDNAVMKKCTVTQYGAAAQVDYLFQTARPEDTTPE
jgi:hypothetical protein